MVLLVHSSTKKHLKIKDTTQSLQHIVFTMEQEIKFCTRCRKIKEVSHFQVSNETLRKTCNQCHEYYATSENKKHKSLPYELSKIELKQLIKSIVWNDDNNELQENDNPAIELQCTLSMEEFEGNNEELAKDIVKYIQSCDGYSYK